MSNKKSCKMNTRAIRALKEMTENIYCKESERNFLFEEEDWEYSHLVGVAFDTNNWREKPKYSQRFNGPRTSESRTGQKRTWEKECKKNMLSNDTLQTPTINKVELLLAI